MYVRIHINQKTVGRIKLLLLMAMFLAPLVVAYTLFTRGWYSRDTVNYGELIQPARSLSGTGLHSIAGQTFTFDAFPHKWTMLYVGSARCPSACQTALYRMRQVHLAQGRQANRVQRVFVATDDTSSSDLWFSDYPGMQILTGATDAIDAWARQYGLLPDRTYLVDPLGNLMMSYPLDSSASGMRKDLSRLLRASQIG